MLKLSYSIPFIKTRHYYTVSELNFEGYSWYLRNITERAVCLMFSARTDPRFNSNAVVSASDYDA